MPRKKKQTTTGRASGITQTSLALPKSVLKDLDEYAESEVRSRSSQMLVILQAGIDKWKKERSEKLKSE